MNAPRDLGTIQMLSASKIAKYQEMKYFNPFEISFSSHLPNPLQCSITNSEIPFYRCRGGNAGGIYLFGGEFSSPKQGTFYHYNDFWRFEPNDREWTRIEVKGKTPPARSGHRMTYYKNYIILFGGFQDTSQQTKYLADLWLYDTQNFVWHNPILPIATQKPDARSSFSFLPHELGAVLLGGYSRIKATIAGKKTKGSAQALRNILKPVIHEDCFFLRIVQPATDAQPNTPPQVRWERRKRPVNTPVPLRAGATMTFHRGRGLLFGGVHDVEETDEAIESEFFNELFAYNIERNRYFPLALRKTRANNQRKPQVERGGRRRRVQANEDELLRNLAALGTGKSIADAEEMEIVKEKDEDEEKLPTKEVLMEFPHPRFNAQMTVHGDILFIYGGTFEKGDREYTFDEMYAIDLGKMDGVKQIFRREPENWLGDEEEESDDDDEEDDSEDDEEEEEEEEEGENEEGDAKMEDAKPLYTESTRKSKRKEKAPADESEISEDLLTSPTSSTSTSTSTFDDTPDDSVTTPEDNLPHPRPFESRRDFFQRTGNEWQEVLMQGLRWKGVQPETLSVKEIKTRAFEMSEEKWWDCREEVTRLEDEQDAAGIGEVVALADRGEGAGAGVGRRR